MAVLVLLVEFGFGDRSVLGPLELQTLDWRFRLRGTEQPGGRVVLVLADDPTVASLGHWPPARGVYGAAIERLAAAGPAVILVNLLLAESPEGSSDDADRRLARAIATAGNVVLTYPMTNASVPASELPNWFTATAYSIHTGMPPIAYHPGGVRLPDPVFGSAAASLGHVSLLLERDGSLRADLPAVPLVEDLYPSAVVEAARLALVLGRNDVEVREDTVRLGDRAIPLDTSGRQLLYHYGAEGTLPSYPLGDLLAGRIAPDRLRDKVIVLGVSAEGAGERFATPFAANLPGSEHLATAIDNLLTGRVLRRGAFVRAADGLLAALVALAASFLAGRRSPWWSLLAVLLLLAGLASLLQIAFSSTLVWLAAIPPTAAILASAVAVEALRLAGERARRHGLERQKANLARYFPPPVVERLAASDRPMGLDRTQEAVIMFVDIVGFTRLSETMTPADAMALLRRFHTLVERAVFAHGGMLNDFMGDGAMVCFGVPDPSPTAAADAVGAALDLVASLAAAPEPRLRVGIGIHGGPVLMGDIGGATQFQFTVIGDAVNVASRLETLTRAHDTPLIVSGPVIAAAGLGQISLARFAPLPELAIRGREGRLGAWRLLA